MSNNKPWILGIAASHNGGACLIKGDEIFVCIQEERLSRYKRERLYPAFSRNSIEYCLSYAQIKAKDLAMVVVCTQTSSKLYENDIRFNPLFEEIHGKIPIKYIPHHIGHALCCYGTSGMKESAIIVVDGMGSPSEDIYKFENINLYNNLYETISIYFAQDKTITTLKKQYVKNGEWLITDEKKMPRFNSLGGMYAAVSKYIFNSPNEAGKVMGLAHYGNPTISVEKFYTITDGNFKFNNHLPLKFENIHQKGWQSTRSKNLAASVQNALDIALLELSKETRILTNSKNLCYGGGVALNCITNTKLNNETHFSSIYIHPASEDNGTAIGAAIYGAWQLTPEKSLMPLKKDSLGMLYDDIYINKALNKFSNISWTKLPNIINEVVKLLLQNKIIGWFQDGSEYGPRALGNRSIICNPIWKKSKKVLNLKVKHRESFRPFAPIIMFEHYQNWFESNGLDNESLFMLKIAKFKKYKSELIPGVKHIDDTARYQTIKYEHNKLLYNLIGDFYRETGVPIILNTSFNVMGEPIVETPEDALNCFISTKMDYCVIENYLIWRK